MRRDPFGNPLHVRMHYKHGAYWYVTAGKWTRLAAEYSSAMQSYAAKIGPAQGMAKLIDETYRSYELKVKSGMLSNNSLRQYGMVREKIDTAFEEFAPSQVKPKHVASFLDFYYEDRQQMGNTALVVLRAAFRKGVRWGLCDYNPAAQVERFDKVERDRYITDDEFRAIWGASNDWMQLVIEMCYLTAQRIGDVLHIKQSDISKDGIFFQQQKTKKRLLVETTPLQEEVVRKARGMSKVAGVYLFAKSASQPRHYATVRRNWIAACKAVGVEDALLHDLRAKSITDADAEGLDAQKLAGHITPQMTERYLRLLRTDRVQSPTKLRQSIDKLSKGS